MSGGSYDYARRRIEDFAEALQQTSPLRKAFAKLLVAVAEAAHNIKWVDSGDCSPGDEDRAVRAALGSNADMLELAEYVEQARVLMAALNITIKRAEAQKR